MIRRRGYLLSIFLLSLCLVSGALYSTHNSYVLMVEHLSAAPSIVVARVLEKEGIHFRLTDQGQALWVKLSEAQKTVKVLKSNGILSRDIMYANGGLDVHDLLQAKKSNEAALRLIDRIVSKKLTETSAYQPLFSNLLQKQYGTEAAQVHMYQEEVVSEWFGDSLVHRSGHRKHRIQKLLVTILFDSHWVDRIARRQLLERERVHALREMSRSPDAENIHMQLQIDRRVRIELQHFLEQSHYSFPYEVIVAFQPRPIL